MGVWGREWAGSPEFFADLQQLAISGYQPNVTELGVGKRW